MNILITGSSGFLGKEVKLALKKNGFNLFFISRKKIRNKKYLFCDLKNLKKLKITLEKLKPNVVINLAAEINFKNKTKNTYKINSLSPYVIAKFCKKNNSHFIQASTIMINGVKSNYSIYSKYNPVNDYSKSKLKADNFIKSTKCKYTILRFGGIYGKRGPTHLGINKFITMASKGKKISFQGNKASLRNYIFVKDAAKVILKCIKSKKYGTFYIGGQVLSFERMLILINKILGKGKKIKFISNPEKKSEQIIKSDKIINYTSFRKSLEIIKCI